MCTLAVSYQAGKYISEATFMAVSIHSDLSFQGDHDAREPGIFQRKLIQNNSSDTRGPLEQPNGLTKKYASSS